jgi:hypothetical protein
MEFTTNFAGTILSLATSRPGGWVLTWGQPMISARRKTVYTGSIPVVAFSERWERVRAGRWQTGQVATWREWPHVRGNGGGCAVGAAPSCETVGITIWSSPRDLPPPGARGHIVPGVARTDIRVCPDLDP